MPVSESRPPGRDTVAGRRLHQRIDAARRLQIAEKVDQGPPGLPSTARRLGFEGARARRAILLEQQRHEKVRTGLGAVN